MCAVLLLPLPACNGLGAGLAPGPEEVPPVDWASDVCEAIGGFLTEFRAGTAEIFGPMVFDPEVRKQELVDLLEQAAEDVERMIDEVEATGYPAVEEGEQLADELVENLQPLQQDFEDLIPRAEDMPTGSREEFTEALGEVGAAIDASTPVLNQAGAQLTATSSELRNAFIRAEACETLYER